MGVAPGATRRMRWLLLALPVLAMVWPSHAIVDTCDICGRRPLAPGHGEQKHRKGGVNALPGSWPWIVSLQLPTITGHNHTCGGSLITSRWVVTAAHCFRNKRNLPHWRAVIGATKLSSLGPEVHVRFIRQVVIHEDYKPTTEVNDIALMELDQPIKCSDYIQPACMPDSTVKVPTLTNCYIGGWGVLRKRAAKMLDVMQEAKVKRFSVEQCNSTGWYSGDIQEHNLCAGYKKGGIDSCQGDSGGPLMCKEEAPQPFWVIGITSWGRGCGKARRPGVYTATQPFYSWVKAWAGPMPQPPPILETTAPAPTLTLSTSLKSTTLPTTSHSEEVTSQELKQITPSVPKTEHTSVPSTESMLETSTGGEFQLNTSPSPPPEARTQSLTETKVEHELLITLPIMEATPKISLEGNVSMFTQPLPPPETSAPSPPETEAEHDLVSTTEATLETSPEQSISLSTQPPSPPEASASTPPETKAEHEPVSTTEATLKTSPEQSISLSTQPPSPPEASTPPPPETKAEHEPVSTTQQTLAILPEDRVPLHTHNTPPPDTNASPPASPETKPTAPPEHETETSLQTSPQTMTHQESQVPTEPKPETSSQPESTTSTPEPGIELIPEPSPPPEPPGATASQAPNQSEPQKANNGTVATFFKLLQNFLHHTRKEKGDVWPKVTEVELIEEVNVPPEEASNQLPPSELPAGKEMSPCQQVEITTVTAARKCSSDANTS